MQQYLLNVKNTFTELKMDFIGINFNNSDFLSSLLYIIFTSLFFFYLFLIGQKIRKLLFPKTKLWKEKYFITVGLGYIIFCSGIALLGIFSILTPLFLYLYLLFATLFILLPIKSFLSECKELISAVKSTKISWKNHRWLKVGILILFLISFLRLLPPEIGADAISYHTGFPKLYLHYETLMIEPKGTEASITIPQLGEMPYVLTLFFNIIDASRFIHFSFYLLSIFLLIFIANRITKNNFSFFVALIFMTSPIILHIAYSAHSDFYALFCFLLATAILTREKKLSKNTLILSGVIFGGALATKIWMLLLLPAFLLFILLRTNILKRKYLSYSLRYAGIFILFSFIIAAMWYLRSYALSGNFLYHSEIISPNIEPSDISKKLSTILNMSAKTDRYFLTDFSPLFFIGILGILFSPLVIYKKIKDQPIFLLIGLLLLLSIFLPSDAFNLRFLIPVYALLILISSFGLLLFIKHLFGKIFMTSIIIFLISYYCMNSLSFLPYGLGWANKENFLKRMMLRENAYYNYTDDFTNNTSKNEVIATYGIITFYYANFVHKHVYHVFSEKNNSLKDLKEENISKLLIKGGDLNWFCKELDVKDCQKDNVRLLASYPHANLYLYELR